MSVGILTQSVKGYQADKNLLKRVETVRLCEKVERYKSYEEAICLFDDCCILLHWIVAKSAQLQSKNFLAANKGSNAVDCLPDIIIGFNFFGTP